MSEWKVPRAESGPNLAAHNGSTPALYRLLSEHARDAMLLLGADNRILEVNKAAEKMYGYSREELLRLLLQDLRAPETHAQMAEQLRQAWSTGLLFETVHRRHDGSHFPVEVNSQAAAIDGTPVLISAVRDISDRRQIEEKLRTSELRYRSLFEHMREGVVICELLYGPDGRAADYRLLDVNPACCIQAGLAREQMLGRLGSEVAGAGEAPFLKACAQVVETGIPISFETYVAPLKRHLSISAFPLHDHQFAIVLANITERKRVEEHLRQSQKMEAIGRLAGGIAHDFNNLLMVILGYNDILLSEVPEEDPLRRYAESIRQAAERASKLTKQLLAFSRKQVLQPEVLDLNAVIADTAKLLRRLIGEDIELITSLDPDLGRVMADAGQMTQVLLNLAVNARDAMPRGGKLIVGTANVELDDAGARARPDLAPGPHVMLTVTDDGDGIDPEIQDRLFEPFFTTKPAGKGTGLGLATIYGIVKQSGGDVTVYSELGHGTTFKIYLPRLVTAAEAPRRAEDLGVPRGCGETILVVEDDAAVAALTGRMLEELGYKAVIVSDPEEALRLVACRRIDLLLSDVVLPGIAGPDLAQKMRMCRPDLPVLYISGYPGAAIYCRGLLPERQPLIQKPFSAHDLALKLRELLPHDRPAPGSSPEGDEK